MTTKRLLTTTARATVLQIIEELGEATDHDIATEYLARVADYSAPPASRGLLRTVRRQLVRSGHVTDHGRARTAFGRTAKVWTRADAAPEHEHRHAADQSTGGPRAREHQHQDDRLTRGPRAREL